MAKTEEEHGAKVIWAYLRPELDDIHVCEHYRDLNKDRPVLRYGQRAPLSVFVKVHRLEVIQGGEDYEVEACRILLCEQCELKARLCDPNPHPPFEPARWAIIVRDTGEVLHHGDQAISPERVRELVLAELAEEEKGSRKRV
jgi:hypothetical protein